MDLEQALADLQREFAQFKQDLSKVLKLKGVPGPTGPPGDIHAAVINATEAAEKVAITAAKAAVVYPFQNKVDQLRGEFQSLKLEFKQLESYLDERIENTVNSHVVQTLRDYGVLDEQMQPVNKTYLNMHLKQLGLLKN